MHPLKEPNSRARGGVVRQHFEIAMVEAPAGLRLPMLSEYNKHNL
jgi:hypothetical protein